MDADGNDPRQIINALQVGGAPFTPTWSPDGKQIACALPGRDEGGIYIMDIDGQNARRVSPLGIRSYNPAWSPDGKWIAYDAYDADANPLENLHVGKNIFIVSVEGGDPRQITQHPLQNACPAWVSESIFSVSPTVDTRRLSGVR